MPCILKKQNLFRHECFGYQGRAFSAIKNFLKPPFSNRTFETKNGISLVASIMLLVFASIAILGVTTFVIQRLRENEIKQIRTRSIYLAQAGMNRAIYDFRTLRNFPLGQVNLDANNFYILSATDAQLLMVRTTSTFLSPLSGVTRFRNLVGIGIRNATNSRTITIDRMQVSCSATGHRLQGIWINGVQYWNGGVPGISCPQPPGFITADLIPNFMLNNPTIYPLELRFNSDMSGVTITSTFIMFDGSLKGVITLFPASANNIFTVQSTGGVVGSNARRTLVVDYNTATERVTNYNEIP